MAYRLAQTYTPAQVARAVDPQESVVILGGHRNITPIVAGVVCGGVLIILWVVIVTVYFRRRYRRRKHRAAVAAGLAEPKTEETPKGTYIIPPDPAIVDKQCLANQSPPHGDDTSLEVNTRPLLRPTDCIIVEEFTGIASKNGAGLALSLPAPASREPSSMRPPHEAKPDILLRTI